jgi:hypothetical protein
MLPFEEEKLVKSDVELIRSDKTACLSDFAFHKAIA